ncbi:MAG: acyl-CoA dehydrogenase family protein [Salinirussus sp.]
MIGEDTSLTPAEREYLEERIRILEEDVFVDDLGPEHIEALDRNEESEADWREYISRMAEHDFPGITIPEEYNGAGGTYVETALAEQAIGYTGAIVHACQLSETQHVGRTMYEHGTEHVKNEYLAPMLDGELIVSQAYTEPSSGTDLAHVGTTAEKAGDEWIMNGEKRFIDFAKYGDFYFTPCRTSGTDGDREGVSMFVVPADAAGIEIVQDQSDWHGFRGTGAAWMRFDNVHVPDTNLIGDEGAAWSYITDELNLEHVTVARYCLGASERAIEIAANYTMHREVNERPVSRYQAVNHAIAEMTTKLDAGYLLNTRAARILDANGLSAGRMEGAMAKWFGNDIAYEIADTCIQIMGGIGTTTSYPVERIQRDLRSGRFLGGASEVMKSIVQHDAYERLEDDTFDGRYVGREIDGLPWLTDDGRSVPADDD